MFGDLTAGGPVIGDVINVNSPLRYDARMLGGLITYARAGQVCFITPFILAGAMSPITMASALAQQNAEALAGIGLTQLVNPGAPVIYGGFTTNVDMKSGGPAFGTPEGGWALLVGAQLARRYRLPYRGSGGLTNAKLPDAQAAYETMWTLWPAVLGHTNLVMHAAGWLDGGLTASYEKFMIDVEMLAMFHHFLHGFAIDDETLALEMIAAVGSSGHHLGTPHTLARHRTEFYQSALSQRQNYESWLKAGAPDTMQRANIVWKEMLARYEAPLLDPAIKEALQDYVARRERERWRAKICTIEVVMTEFFAYDTLTWPDIAALPRDLPLVIPLGQGYNLSRLAGALSNPARVGLLPAIPFGWRGSGLAVPECLLGQLVGNLLDSLRDDGFSRVYALCPQGLDLGLGAARIALPQQSRLEPASPLPADSDRNKVILMPIGHTEQHGHHLPMFTDTVIIEAISRGTAAAAPEQAVSLPVFPYGVSTHRPAFAGTLNVGGRAFEDFWLGVVDVLVARGFDRFYLLSGHGGNCSFLVNVVKYAGERHHRIFCATTWLYLSGPEGIESLQQHRRSARGGMGHAGELETALMLHLQPEWVHLERVVDETDFIATPSYYMDWVEGGALVANPPWADDTATGAYGAGSLATAANGQIWLEAAIAEKVAHVAEIHEQHRRREERRNRGYGLCVGVRCWGQTGRGKG